MNMVLNASSRRLARLVPGLVCLAMLGAGCGQQKVPAPQQEADRQARAAESLHMARLYVQWQREVQGPRRAPERTQMPLNLSDEVQYRFVQNRLLASGSTPENAPRLFRQLEQLRDKTRREEVLVSTAADEAPASSWCGHLLPLTDVASADATVARFQASGLVTCFNGSDYAYADVTAFATDAARTRFRVLGTQSLEAYAGAVLETPPLDLSLKGDPGELLLVDSVAVAFNEATGESHLSYTMAESSLVALASQDINLLHVQHPRELIGRHMPDNPIRTCLERGGITGYLDCDYVSGNKDPVTGAFKPFSKPFTGLAAANAEAIRPPYGSWIAYPGDYWTPAGGVYDISRLYIPLRGEYQVLLPSECSVDAITSDASVILLEKGGRCTAGTAPGTEVLKGSIPFQAPRRDDYDRTRLLVPFNGLADFGHDCVDHMQNVRLLLRATLKATCIDKDSGLSRPYTRSRFHTLQNLDFRNACLAEGTQVVRADGKRVPVEQVKVGDRLLANGTGLALTVTTVSRGGESQPLVRLRDERGGEVRVTRTHPVVTARHGVVRADALKVGDEVLTRAGASRLVEVERVSFTGEVFNFALGTPEELAAAGPEARTLYANGFLVGDSQTQTELEKQPTRDAREVLARLHPAWHGDYQRHLARQRRTRR